MLELKDVSIAINDKIVIANLSMCVNRTDKLAIISEEGNGKSTLLKAIMNIADYATLQGSIISHNHKIAYLKQILDDKDLAHTVHSFLFENEEHYYNKIAQMYTILASLSLDDTILEKEMKMLSGGEKVKVQLLKLLLEEPDILLLDEPTNDLDIPTLQWLTTFINESNCAIIFVSHDETLLAQSANRILHLELRNKKQKPFHTLVSMDYDAYIEMRINQLQKQTQNAYNQKREHTKKVAKVMRQMQQVDHQLNTVSRQQPHAAKMLKRKMNAVKNQEHRLENETLSEVPDVEESITLFFDSVQIPSKKEILNLHLDTLQINNHILAHNINLQVYGAKHIGIIGNNGVGKTTLLKIIHNELSLRSDIHVGYMPQEYDTILNSYSSAIDFLCNEGKKEDITTARKCLGNLNFTRDEMVATTSSLSGGSKAKLILLKLILEKYDVLLLDEPTRNVSPLSNPIIRSALANYSGCIISISHDRKYLNEVCDCIYELKENGLHQL